MSTDYVNNIDRRMKQAGSASATEAMLLDLSDDPSEEVRAAVAGNEQTPPHILVTLAMDAHGLVRCGVAGNDGAPDALIEALTQDWDGFIAFTARWNLSRRLEAAA